MSREVNFEAGPIDEVASANAVRRKLRGRPKPREEVIAAVEQETAKIRSNIDQKYGPSSHVLWQFWAPGPEAYFRWRVQLGCGCIEEILSRGEDSLPHEHQTRDPFALELLPAGQVWHRCSNESHKPYRKIAVWNTRSVETYPADPVEPPDYMQEIPEVWAKLRHAEPYNGVVWRVTLSCGHAAHVTTNLDWKPEDGPQRLPADSSRLHELEEAYSKEQWWEQYPEVREHELRMIADGWPIPQTEQDCFICPNARPIVAYEPIGWLVRKPTPPPQPRKPSRHDLEQKLAKAQRSVERLHEQLAALDEDGDEPEAGR
jgi:hypothetical protein